MILKIQISLFTSANLNEKYLFLTNLFSKKIANMLIQKRRPREEIVRLVLKELRKAIYAESRFRNKFLRNSEEINRKLQRLCKQQQSNCVSIRRKSIKQYFSNITSKRIITSKNFL